MESNCGIMRAVLLRIRRGLGTSSRAENAFVANYEAMPVFDGLTETDSEQEVLLNLSVAPQVVSIERAHDGSNGKAEQNYGFNRDKNC
jgi:hypothetical protein